MKNSILVKLLTTLFSIFIMALSCAIIFFPEEIFSCFIFGIVVFFIFYFIGGMPVSLIISKIINPSNGIIIKKLIYVFLHILGGLAVTILYLLITDPEPFIREASSKDVFTFYKIGIASGLVFSLTELTILKVKKSLY